MTRENIQKHSSYLRVLHDARNNKKLKHAIIKNCNKEVIMAICEIIDNILAGHLRLPQAKVQKLKKYKLILYKLANKKLCLSKRRNLLIQNGGFLGTLLPLALGFLPDIVKGIAHLFAPAGDETETPPI